MRNIESPRTTVQEYQLLLATTNTSPSTLETMTETSAITTDYVTHVRDFELEPTDGSRYIGSDENLSIFTGGIDPLFEAYETSICREPQPPTGLTCIRMWKVVRNGDIQDIIQSFGDIDCRKLALTQDQIISLVEMYGKELDLMRRKIFAFFMADSQPYVVMIHGNTLHGHGKNECRPKINLFLFGDMSVMCRSRDRTRLLLPCTL